MLWVALINISYFSDVGYGYNALIFKVSIVQILGYTGHYNFLLFFCGRNIGNKVGFGILSISEVQIHCAQVMCLTLYMLWLLYCIRLNCEKEKQWKSKKHLLHHPISNSKETASVLHIVWKFMCVRATSLILKCLIMSEHHFWGMYYNTGLLSAKVVLAFPGFLIFGNICKLHVEIHFHRTKEVWFFLSS